MVKIKVKKNKIYLELSKNENRRHENLKYTAIGKLRGKFIGLNACFRKAKKIKINC